MSNLLLLQRYIPICKVFSFQGAAEKYLDGIEKFVTQAECIYHDQIGDLMLRQPNGRPDGSQATRLLMGDQIAPGDQIGDQIPLILNGVASFGQI